MSNPCITGQYEQSPDRIWLERRWNKTHEALCHQCALTLDGETPPSADASLR